LLLFTILIWGTTGPIGKFVLGSLEPLTLLSYRFFLSTLILSVVVLSKKKHLLAQWLKLKFKDKLLLLISSTFGSTIQLSLLYWGFSLTSSIEGTVINSTSPIWVALFGHYFLKEKISPKVRIGLFIGFIGSLIVALDPIFHDQAVGSSSSLLGNFLIISATAAWVIFVILNKRLLRHNLHPELLTFVQSFVGFVGFMALNLILSTPKKIIDQLIFAHTEVHLAIFYMAVFSGLIAYIFYQKALKKIDATKAEIYTYLIPLISTPIGILWLKESTSPLFIIGAGIIAIGVFTAEFSKRKRL
jgi:drug/metabolite transporter (DMT)-like permease